MINLKKLIKLRPHHLQSVIDYYNGELDDFDKFCTSIGYGENFSKKIYDLWSRTVSDQTLKVLLVYGSDDVCHICKFMNPSNKYCKLFSYLVNAFDIMFIDQYNLEVGKIYSVSDIIKTFD